MPTSLNYSSNWMILVDFSSSRFLPSWFLLYFRESPSSHEMNSKINDSMNVHVKRSFLSAAVETKGTSRGEAIGRRSFQCFWDDRVKRKSPTLIGELEVNCSLICNVFVLNIWQGKSQKCVSLQWLAARSDISLSWLFSFLRRGEVKKSISS